MVAGMKRLLFIFALVAACDSPSPRFADQVAKQIVLDGSTFSVRHTAYEAEVIRTNVEPGVRRADILRKAVAAIRQSSGCEILPGSVYGDTNVVRADIKCPGADEALRPVRPDRLDCVGYEDPYFEGLVEIECDLIRG